MLEFSFQRVPPRQKLATTVDVSLPRRQFRGSPPYTSIPSLGEDDIVRRLFEIDGRIEIAVDN